MKHWDGRDRAEASLLRAPRHDDVRPPSRRDPPKLHSLFGLVLAVGLLVGLSLLLTPSGPVSPVLRN